MARFCQKNLHSLKNTMLSCNFFQIFHEKPPSVMPIFGKKNVNSVITTLQYGTKKSIGCPFFRYFTKKSLLSCPYFVKTTSTIIWIMHQRSQQDALFFRYFMKKSMLLCPYFVNITLRGQKQTTRPPEAEDRLPEART